MSIISLKNKFSDSCLVVFDSDCPFCSKQVRFIEKHNKNQKFLYVPRSSEAGKKIRQEAQLENLESLLLVNKTTIYTESDAVIHLFSQLPFPYFFISYGKVVPLFIRNLIYRFIAKYRQKIPIKHCSFNNELKKNIIETFQ